MEFIVKRRIPSFVHDAPLLSSTPIKAVFISASLYYFMQDTVDHQKYFIREKEFFFIIFGLCIIRYGAGFYRKPVFGASTISISAFSLDLVLGFLPL